MWWKGTLVQWFSEHLFHLFLRPLTINIITLINVIDLDHQIIEFGKDRDDGYCELLIWELKDGAIETFSCHPHFKECRFLWD